MSIRPGGRCRSERPLECQGIAVGQFETAKVSYAVLLVPAVRQGTGYKFLVFSRKTDKPSYEPKILELSSNEEARNYFIRKIRIANFFSEESRSKFSVRTRDGILFVASAEDEN